MPILKTEIFMKKMEAMYIYEVNMEPTIHNINLQGGLNCEGYFNIEYTRKYILNFIKI